MVPVADYVRNIKSLKADPARRIVVAALDRADDAVRRRVASRASPDVRHWPVIGHSCGAVLGEDFSYANPAIRIQAFARAFGTNGSVFPICDADYSPALRAIATQVGHALAP